MSASKSDGPPKDKPVVRTHTPRPDELSRETFEFIAAVDQYKRRHMRSFLDDAEVLAILFELGYNDEEEQDEPEATDERLEAFADARYRYRMERGRLFPTWSEVFKLLLELGYKREETDSAA